MGSPGLFVSLSLLKPMAPNLSFKSLLRDQDQSTIAALTVLALMAVAVYWLLLGGHRGQMINIDKTQPLQMRFLVDINDAAWPELIQLPGIGETLARRIVEFRSREGPFHNLGQLQHVHGIGPKLLDRMSPYLLPIDNHRFVKQRSDRSASSVANNETR